MAAARHAPLLVALSLAGCATLSTGESEPDYAQDAETNLARGNKAFESRNYTDAIKYFEYVRSRYPYLDAAKHAELRIADTHFAREEYIEARDAYLNFVKLHPTWPQVDYAAFRAALTHYKEIPSDFFLLPPSAEKDQGEVKNALRAMQDFIRQYPDSKYLPEAEQIVADARRRLARHELYVASFYARRERWRAVANRLETVAEEYRGLGFDEQALFGLHDAYTRLNEKEKARKALEEILARMPGTPAAEKAKAMLGPS
jgi:outer membrane protein assembly factor BamD